MKSKFMKSNFDAIQWCDFFRGVADPSLAKAMEDELQEAPPDLGSPVSLLQQVEITASSEMGLPVPKEMVLQAERIFDLQRPDWTPFLFLPFKLIADSLSQPAFAGTRSSESSHRQLIFETDRYAVSVRSEQALFPSGQAVTGQILRRGEQDGSEDQPMTDIPIVLICEGGGVSRTETGPHGEFQATGLETPPIDLYLFVDRKHCIRLPFDTSDESGRILKSPD